MTFSGTSTISNESGYDIVQAVNGYATAKVTVNDKDFANQATHQANLLKSVIKTHTIYNKKIFRGELLDMRTSYNQVTYNAFDKARKVMNQRAAYNPVLYSGFLRQLQFDGTSAYLLRDDKRSFSTNELAGHLIHVQKGTKDRIRVSPNKNQASLPGTLKEYDDGASSTFKAVTGDPVDSITKGGDINELYYDLDPDIFDETDFNYQFYHAGASSEDIALVEDVYFAVDTGNGISVDSIEMQVHMATRPLAKFGLTDSTNNDPCVGLKDTGTGEYEIAYVRSGDTGATRFANPETIGGNTATRYFIKKVNGDANTDDDSKIADMNDNPSKYLTTVATNGNYTFYKLTVFIGSGQGTSIVKAIKFLSVFLTINLSGDQYPEKGAETISSNDANDMTFGTLGSDGRAPILDGCGQDDTFIITDTLDDQINTLASNWSITINDNITNSSTLALTSDYTNKTRGQVFQDIADLGNALWWYDPVLDQYNIISADNLSSTGITITKNDIVDYLVPGAWSYEVNAENIRDTIVVKVATQADPISVSTTPEFTHALGNEQVVISRPGINSVYQGTKLANNIKHKYENARRRLIFTLDYDNPNQSYTALVIGETIAAQLPDASDTSVCNHDGGTADPDRIELVVTNLQFVRKPGKHNRRLVTVTAEARYS